MEAGDWVRCVNRNHYVYGWIGYVNWIKPPECSVIFTRTRDGQRVNQKRRMLMSEFAVINDIEEWTSPEWEALINLALDMRDEEWFRDLVKRRERGKVGETL
ncbi:IDEAL domain-containing protein [Geobacillus thermodenitrificans]|uniref:IDEAL domain-containing protein n=1 Tax=Geobacillus thermodenitrificans TaxID=33940 RepID=UPI003D2140B5